MQNTNFNVGCVQCSGNVICPGSTVVIVCSPYNEYISSEIVHCIHTTDAPKDDRFSQWEDYRFSLFKVRDG